MIVLDASAVVEVLLQSARGAVAADAMRRNTLVVPAHFDAEAYRALRRIRRRGAMTADGLSRRLSSLATVAAERIPVAPLLASANALGDRFSPPDSLYVALARALDAELVTCDAPLAAACEGIAHVRLI